MVGIIDVEVTSWDKFNPRKDLKASSWFRLNNGIFEDPDFFEFSHVDLLVWVYVLSLASKKQAGKVALNLAHAERIGRFKPSQVKSALKKLEGAGCVTWTSRERNADDTRTSHYERTDHEHADVTNMGTGPEPVPKREAGPTPVSQVRTAFLEAYEREFKKAYPGWGAKENGQASQWLRSVPLERALEYCRAYVAWNDPWITNQGHPFGSLVSQFVKLDAWLNRPEQMARKLAIGRATEKTMTADTQLLAEMEAHHERRQAQANHDNRGGLRPAIPGLAEDGVSVAAGRQSLPKVCAS